METLDDRTLTPSTLVELLRERARLEPDFGVYTFLVDDTQEARFTCAELDRRARAIAAQLQRLGRGQRVLLLYPPGLDYIAAFFGCLYAGAIAVPVYPPRHDRSLRRLQAISADANATVGLIRAEDLELLKMFFPMAPDLEALTWIASDTLEASSADAWVDPQLTREDLAFLQYTSGSTSQPKGVMLSHHNLLRNLDTIRRGFRQDRSSKAVLWLPPYHDMGLIGGILQPLFTGYPVVLLSPMDFLQEPIRWLRAISRHKGTTAGGPDFAFNLCVRKTTPEQRAELDLSSWKVAFNGAEPVRAETMARFAETFAPCGFRPEAFLPCYGLAEATLLVSGGHYGEESHARRFDGTELQRGRAIDVEQDNPGAHMLVSSGVNALDGKILIADPATCARKPDGEIGEIWISDDSVAKGYWNQPELTERVFRATLSGTGEGPFLRTGDLGFMREGQLFVAGRAKDLIIIRGLNHYPQDIERSVERSHRAVRPGSGAAFSVDVGGEERLVITYEVSPQHVGGDFEQVFDAIRRAVAEQHELVVHAILLLEPGTVPKTSSGKIQRHACRAGFLSGELEALARYSQSAAPAVSGEVASSTAPAEALPPLWAEVSEEIARVLGGGVTVEPSRADEHLGLDSLSMVELQHRLQLRLGVTVPLVGLMRGPTLRGVVAEVGAALEARAKESSAVVRQGAETGEFPLTHGQRALWFLQQLAPESSAYHIAAALRFHEAVDVAALRRVVEALVARHPALRTTFHAAEGRPFQRIHERGELDFVLEDASGLDDAGLRARMEDMSRQPFSLEQGPLLRLRMYRRGDTEHVLLIVVHHLVADLWSLANLAQAFSELYPAAARGLPVALPPGQVRFTDYVRWQDEQLAGARGEALWSYWKKQLADTPPVLELPEDHPRPPVQTFRGGTRSRVLDAALTERIKAMGREHGTTLFTTLLSAYGALLHRHNGQRELWVGTPSVGRERAEVADEFGYFVNPVVLRLELSGELPFTGLLARARRTVEEALEHAGLPFGLLVERLLPEREPSRSPLFQTMFALQQAPRRGEPALAALAVGASGVPLRLGGLAVESMELDLRASQFDLSLSVAELGGGLRASLEYNADLFEPETIDRLLEHYETLLRGIAARPEARVAELPLQAEQARAELLTWARQVETTAPECIHTLIEAQARRTPDATAIISGAGQLTYRELDTRANALAWRLRELGAGPEARVVVYLERSLEQLIAVLGVLKAGAAYVPVDPEFGTARVQQVLKEGNIRLAVSAAASRALLEEQGARVLEVGGPEAVRSEPPSSGVSPENLAYVLYTSGSTGRPKGVMISHGALSAFALRARVHYDVTPADRFLQFSSLAFDASVAEIFCSLTTGAALVLRTPAMMDSLPAFLEHGGALGVSVMDLPTAFWHDLTVALEEGGLQVPPSWRVIALGGEQARKDRLAQWHRCVPARVRLFNGYGPTEATVFATHQDLLPGNGEDADVPIGRPLRNMGAYVLDGRLEPVPVGAVGELWLSGEGLARGYQGDPSLTAERFVPHPHAITPGERLYRTGDLARVRADGTLVMLGRVDEQVKVRGFRVELGEIEAALRGCEGVRAAVVVARAEGSGGKRLVAYVVAPPAVTVASLRAQLGARLPSYMVPSAIVRMDAFPMSSSGKVDRRALPPPAAEEVTPGLAPRTPVEEVLSGIWAELLGLERVGVDRDFFELGGHSLLAMQVVSRVREVFGLDLPVRALFEEATVAGVARRLEEARGRPAAPALKPLGHDTPRPLSHAQQRLWFLSRLEPESAAYNEPGSIRLSGALDVAALEASLEALSRRHAVLRTRFELGEDGRPVQCVEPDVRIPLPVDDLRALPAGEREARAKAIAREEAARPFELTRAPLLRARLVRLEDESHLLVVVLHHIICDGWSVAILLKDLGELYSARRAGREPVLSPLPVQYADYAVWQREWLEGGVLDEQLGYWRERLKGAPPRLELPIARSTAHARPGACGLVRRELPASLAAGVRTLSRREGASLFMTLLAGFKALLHRYSGQEDLVVGSALGHRRHRALEELVGFFVNTLVLRTDVSGSPSFRELISRVRETALGAYAHQDVPFEKLVEVLNPERGAHRAPFFQVQFLLQNTPVSALVLEGLDAAVQVELPPTAKGDLMLAVTEQGDALVAEWHFDDERFDAASIGRLAEHFELLLAQAVAHPEAPVDGLPLLTVAERALLSTANDTLKGYSREATLPALFEAQAAARPDAVAVELGAARLTYGELNRRANQLAHHLRARGVGRGVLVGLCVERSLEMVVGLLGILKAGGAYLPLDASYPAERLAFMLRDGQVPVLLTQESLAGGLRSQGGQLLCLDSERALLDAASEANPSPVAEAGDPAYVMYTSGSTGRPKGVCVPHRAVVRLVTSPNFMRLSPEESFLQFAPLSFDASTLEIWGPLLNGGRLVVFPPHAPTLEELGRTLAEGRVTSLWLTAGLFHAMVDHHLEALGGVRQLLAGGDVLSPAHVRRVLERHRGLRLINGYGPTENTTFTCCYPMSSPEQVGASVPIGSPITGTRVYLLDARLRPVPVGVPGELYCAGDGLALGYLNRPELTLEKFLADPFSDEPGARMYRTGDLARWRADGRIEFLGRIDQQVKVRGFRIEPGEVETALLEHPSVREAVVLAVGESVESRRLVAHVVPRESSSVSERELLEFLQGRLPAYMVPNVVVTHAALPLSPNGKVDRQALAQAELPERQVQAGTLVPRTATEATLLTLWREVLGVERVGLEEGFFELGGHSLLATQLVSRIREAMGVELDLRALFEQGTIAAVAERIEALRRGGRAAVERPLGPVRRDSTLPLSYSQQRVWFIHQLDPQSAAYNITGALRLSGEVDVDVLRRCLDTLLERHEVLRTGFHSRDGHPVQVVAPEAKVSLELDDLTALPAEAREARRLEILRADAARPFDLTRPPLVRARLVRLADREYGLIITLHHIVSDGWSLGVLFREMSALYEALSAGRPVPLAPLPIQYADYAWWQRQWLQGELLESQLGYWKRRLAGAPQQLRLPFDRPRPPVQSHRGTFVAGRLGAELTRGLVRLGRAEGATLFMTALAGFDVLVHRLTGQEDVVVGSPIANRTHSLTEGLIGFFVNTVPLRCELRDNPTFLDLLRRVRGSTLEAYDHQDVPFDRLVTELHIERSPSYNPVFQVLFVLQNAPLPELKLGNLTVHQVEPEFEAVKFDLVVILQEEGGGVTVTWNYNTDLFDEATVLRLHRQYEQVLTQLVATPTLRLDQVQLQTEDERQQRNELVSSRRSSDFAKLKSIKPRPVAKPVPDSE